MRPRGRGAGARELHHEKAYGIERSESLSARRKLLAIIHSLPEAQAVPHGGHLGLEVRGRRFGWFLMDHHGDGRIAVHCRVTDELRARLAEEAPRQAHHPKYVSHLGWFGMWLDVPSVPWALVRAMLVDAYRLTAPRTLVAHLAASR